MVSKEIKGVARNLLDYDICLYTAVFMQENTYYRDLHLWTAAINRHLNDVHVNSIIKKCVAYILDKLDTIYGMDADEGFYYFTQYLEKNIVEKYWDLVLEHLDKNNKIKNYIH